MSPVAAVCTAFPPRTPVPLPDDSRWSEVADAAALLRGRTRNDVPVAALAALDEAIAFLEPDAWSYWLPAVLLGLLHGNMADVSLAIQTLTPPAVSDFARSLAQTDRLHDQGLISDATREGAQARSRHWHEDERLAMFTPRWRSLDEPQRDAIRITLEALRDAGRHDARVALARLEQGGWFGGR